MTKKELLKAIRNKDKERLSSILFSESASFLTAYESFLHSDTVSVWLGDYLYWISSQKKIKEEDLLFVLTLTDKEGNNWLDYIGKKSSIYCTGIIKCLSKLVAGEFLSIQNIEKLYFKPAPDGWTFCALIAKYQNADTINYFLSTLENFVTQGRMKPSTVMQGLATKISKDWTFLHCLAKYTNSDCFIGFIKTLGEWYKKEWISGEALISFFNMVTVNNVNAFELTDSIYFSPLMDVLFNIYQQSNHLFSHIFDFLANSPSGNSILYNLLAREQAALLLPLIVNIDKKEQDLQRNLSSQKEAEQLFIILQALSKNLRKNCLHRMVKPKNIEVYEIIINKLCGLIKEKNAHIDQYLDLLIKILLNPDEKGVNHLQLVQQFSTQLPYSNILYLYKFLWHNRPKWVKENLINFLHAPMLENWTILHFAARHLSSQNWWLFFKFIKEALSHLDDLKRTEILTLNPDLTSPDVNAQDMYLEPILWYAEGQPNLIQLVCCFQPFEKVQFFLTSIKNSTLNDRSMRLSLLQSFAAYLPEILVKMKDQSKNSWLLEYISKHIERMFENLMTFSSAEKEVLVHLAQLDVPAANYLLYKYLGLKKANDNYKDKDENVDEDYFNKALNDNYDLALIDKCLRELKSPLRENRTTFYIYCNKIADPGKFVEILELKRNFILNDDYLLLLVKALFYFKVGREPLHYAIASYHYSNQNIKASLPHFDAISFDHLTLPAESHLDLSLTYSHISTTLNNPIYSYCSIKHWQISNNALDFDYAEEVSENEISQNQMFWLADIEAYIKTWVKLESHLLKTTIKDFSIKLREFMFHELSSPQDDQSKQSIHNALKMMLGWCHCERPEDIQTEFNLFISQNKSDKKSITFFSLFNGNKTLTALIESFYKLIMRVQFNPEI